MLLTLAINVPPCRNVSLVAGCWVMMGGLFGTVMVELAPVVPFTVALIVALPVPIAVTRPLAFTVNTPVLLLLQFVTELVTLIPDAVVKLATALAGWLRPSIIVSLVTETLMDVGVRSVTTTEGPAAALTARYKGDTAPSQILNS